MENPIVKVDALPIGPLELEEDEVQCQVQKIQRIMKSVMKKDEHFGVIPGCGTKPTLLKPGAEKLGFTFRLAPKFDILIRELPKGHREVEVTCTLTHIPTGQFIAQGVGSCSTMESKYRYRTASLKCPECGNDSGAFMKSKKDPGFFCWAKRGGCGANLPKNHPGIIDQEVGRIENPDIADTYNTVLKMSKKRAHVDGILTATAASDIFTQDIEDMPELRKEAEKEEQKGMPSRGKGAPEKEDPKATEPQRRKLFAMLNKLQATEEQQKDFVYFCAGRSSTEDITRPEIQEMYRILEGLTEPFMLKEWLQHAEESYAIDAQ